MTKLYRVVCVLIFAIAASLSLQSASAQMMHFTLNVVIETEDGAPIPAGEVCVSGEVDPICQDIPADSPNGKEFSFPGLADGDHDITVSAEPYLEALDHVTITENTTTVTVTLQIEDTAPPADDLPNTGAGSTALETSAATPLLLTFAGLAFAMFSLGLAQRRRER